MHVTMHWSSRALATTTRSQNFLLFRWFTRTQLPLGPWRPRRRHSPGCFSVTAPGSARWLHSQAQPGIRSCSSGETARAGAEGDGMDGSRMVWPKMPGQVGNFEGCARVCDSFAENQKNWNCRFQISVVFHPWLGMMILNEQCSKPRLVGDDRGLEGGFTKWYIGDYHNPWGESLSTS